MKCGQMKKMGDISQIAAMLPGGMGGSWKARNWTAKVHGPQRSDHPVHDAL